MITIIVAVTRDGGIGRAGDMLFHIKADLQRFRQLTMGYPLIMGRKTFESLPGGPLPGRRNIVVTRNKQYTAPGAEICDSLQSAIDACAEAPDIMIIGGAQIYAQAMPLADRLLMTEIDAIIPDTDTFFPSIDTTVWTDAPDSPQPWQSTSRGTRFRFRTLIRK